MSKSKETALLEIDLDVHYYGTTARNRVGEVIDEYAKSQCIAFSRWMFANKVELCLGIIVSNFGTHDSEEQLYDLFIQHQSQQP